MSLTFFELSLVAAAVFLSIDAITLKLAVFELTNVFDASSNEQRPFAVLVVETPLTVIQLDLMIKD